MNTNASNTRDVSREALAELGSGYVAYMRELSTEEITNLYPNAPQLTPGDTLWVLLSANGEPILLGDSAEAVKLNAKEQNLVTVAVH